MNENERKNLITSPLGIHIVLSMAALGAGGITAQQMREQLYINDSDFAQQEFESLLARLNVCRTVTLLYDVMLFYMKFGVKESYWLFNFVATRQNRITQFFFFQN